MDDILWTGGKAMEEKMDEAVKHYRFGKIEKNEFKYSGRPVLRDEKGIHVTCPNWIDRVKHIYMGRRSARTRMERSPRATGSSSDQWLGLWRG